MDSLSALSAFVRAAEVRSFTDAGRQLSLSSSAIGKAVARLEERHGVRLFHRSTRSITLTQEGKLFLESCRRIFSEIKNVELEFAQTKGAPKGKLCVSLPLLGMLMMPTLDQFMKAYPEIDLDLDFTDGPVDAVDSGYDVAVRTGDVIDSRLMSRGLGTYQFEVVGSPDYFARAGLPLNPEELAAHSCLHRRCATTGKLERWPIVASERSAPPPSTRVAASAFEPLIALAELGAGIVCVPDFAIRSQIEDGSLIPVLRDYIANTEAVRALWSSNRYQSPKVRVFVDFLAKHLLAKKRGNSPSSVLQGAAPSCSRKAVTKCRLQLANESRITSEAAS